MLAREHRLRSNNEIREVVRRGKRFSNHLATLHYLPSETNKFAVVTSKHLGNAVIRNKVRRRTKAALFAFQSKSPAIMAVCRLKPEAATANWDELSRGISDLMGRIK